MSQFRAATICAVPLRFAQYCYCPGSFRPATSKSFNPLPEGTSS